MPVKAIDIDAVYYIEFKMNQRNKHSGEAGDTFKDGQYQLDRIQ